MRRLLLSMVLVVFACQSALAADVKDQEARISWRYERIGEGERDAKYLAGGSAMRFYWNDAFVGVGRAGLAEVYDKLKVFEGESVVFMAHPRVPEDKKFLEGPAYMDNPLERDDAFVHFYRLLRKKNVKFTIEFKDDPREPRYGGPNYNPFREEK